MVENNTEENNNSIHTPIEQNKSKSSSCVMFGKGKSLTSKTDVYTFDETDLNNRDFSNRKILPFVKDSSEFYYLDNMKDSSGSTSSVDNFSLRSFNSFRKGRIVSFKNDDAYTNYLEIGKTKNESPEKDKNKSILLFYNKKSNIIYSLDTTLSENHFLDVQFNDNRNI